MKLLLIQSPSVEDHTKERVYPIGIVILCLLYTSDAADEL